MIRGGVYKQLSWVRYTAKLASLIGVCLIVMVDVAQADDRKLGSAAGSLQSILQQAADDGLVKYKSDKKPVSTPAMIEKETVKENTSEILSEALSAALPLPSKISKQCRVFSSFDPADYKHVTDIDVLHSTQKELSGKGGEQHSPVKSAVTLAMHYASLGLGAEIAAMKDQVNDDYRPFMIAVGRTVAGYPSREDAALLAAQKPCGGYARIWSDLANASVEKYEQDKGVEIYPNTIATIYKWPPHLALLAKRRLAIYAVEAGDIIIGEKVIADIAPEAKYGELPHIRDDDMLYLFALVRRARDDARFAGILEHLSTRDGIYRTRALQILSHEHSANGLPLPSDFQTDIAMLKVQYDGQAESRIAIVEEIKQHLVSLDYTAAVAQARSNLPPNGTEHKDMVDLIGGRLTNELGSEDQQNKLYALNGYFYDPAFFDEFAKFLSLIDAVKTAAIDLNFPELALLADTKLPKVTDKDVANEMDIALVSARLALKSGEYQEGITLLTPFKSDQQAAELLVKLASGAGDKRLLLDLHSKGKIEHLTEPAITKLAMTMGDWNMAAHYRAAPKIKTSANDISDSDEKLAASQNPTEGLVDYLAEKRDWSSAQKIPEPTTELRAMMKTLKSDTATMKAFLQGG